MVALPNVSSADMTTAIRDFGSEVARDIYKSPTKLLAWAASALDAAVPNADGVAADTPHPTTNFVIVDRSLTRC